MTTVESGDGLDESALASALNTRWLGRRHLHLPTCASTNDVAAAQAREGAGEGLVVTADAQTGGRGRQGRVWHSPPGTNIYASLLLRPRRPAPEIPPLTLLIGGALAQALGDLGFRATVKWPNDLLLTDEHGWRRKVAGILVEATTEGERIGHVVVGCGINVNTVAFPEELVHKATSLRLARGGGGERGEDAAMISRAAVLGRVLAACEAAYDRFQQEGVGAAIALWNAHADLGRSCHARVEGREISGVMAGVAADGALLIDEPTGLRHRIVAGEVVINADDR